MGCPKGIVPLVISMPHSYARKTTVVTCACCGSARPSIVLTQWIRTREQAALFRDLVVLARGQSLESFNDPTLEMLIRCRDLFQLLVQSFSRRGV
jgi:hypothetical protein